MYTCHSTSSFLRFRFLLPTPETLKKPRFSSNGVFPLTRRVEIHIDIDIDIDSASKGPRPMILVLVISLFAARVSLANGQSQNGTTQTVTANDRGVPTEYTLPKPFVVCTLLREPMAVCSTASNSSTEFTGLSIQAFREIAKDAFNWVEGENYQFACVETGTSPTLYDRVVPEDGDCDAFIASTTITSERQKNGVVFAQGYYGGSIGVVTKSAPKTSSGWAWTRPFTWQLWLALGVTALLLPLIIYLLEVMSIKRQVSVKDTVRGYNESAWRTVWVMVQGETMAVTNLAARTVVIVLCFASLILSSSYTANLAAFLTLKSYGEINGISDLIGLSVSTIEVYQDRFLEGYGLRTINTTISSPEDIRRELRDVESGRLAAFLFDREVVQFMVAQWPQCGLRLLPEVAEPFNYGLAFGRGTPRPVVDAFSVAILTNTEDRTIQAWADDFLLSDSPCLEGSGGGAELDQLSFRELYGLWVMIVASVAVGLVLVLGKRYHKYRRNPEWGRVGAGTRGPTSPRLGPVDAGWPKGAPGLSPAGSSELERRFERGDSRETKGSDLYRIESHLHEYGS